MSVAAESDFEFWTQQFQTECKLLFNYLEDSDLAKQAKSLMLTFENYRKALKGKPLPEQVGELAFPVLELRKLVSTVLQKQRAGEWVGWVVPSFLEQILTEAEYFWKSLTGVTISLDEHLKYWLGALFYGIDSLTRLLDASEISKLNQLALAQRRIFDLNSSVTNAQKLSSMKEMTQQLEQVYSQLGVGTSTLRSAIHPALFDLVLREVRKCSATLDRLTK